MSMQPKDRRLVTESNLEDHTDTKLVPVRASIAAANNTATNAVMVAQTANTTAGQASQQSDNAITRVEHLEAMAGLEPGEVTDAQTANLVQQPGSMTYTALDQATAANLDRKESATQAVFATHTAPQADYVDTLARMASYDRMTLRRTNFKHLYVTCSAPNGASVQYTIPGPERYQYVTDVHTSDPTDPAGTPKITHGFTATDLSAFNFTWNGETTSPWTDQIGATWTQEVTVADGADISFFSYTDNRGGIWRITINGVSQTVSTWSEAPAWPQTILLTNAAAGTYRIRGQFLGADPANPPSSGAARGWMRSVNRTSAGEHPYSITVTTPTRTRLLSPVSNKDFAISIRPETGGTNQFIPHHGQDTESFASPTVYYNGGNPIDLDALEPGFEYPIDSFEWTQHIYGRNTHTGDQNLIEVWTTQKITPNGVFSVTGRWKTLEPVRVGLNIYHCMLMGDIPTFTEAVSSLGGTYALAPQSETVRNPTTEGNRAESWALLSSTSNAVAAVAFAARRETLRVGQPDIRTDDMQTFIELRGDHLAKVYPTIYEPDTVIPAGRMHRFGGTYFYGSIPGARNTISLT